MNKFNFKSLLAILLTLAMVFTIVPMFAVSAEETTATISFANVAQRTVFNSNQQVWEQNGITVTNDKAASTTNVADYSNPARFYASSKLTIAYPGMTKIVVNADASKYATPWKDSIKDSNATVTVDSLTVTITFATPVDSFTVEKLSAQSRVRSMTVYAASSETPEPCKHTDTEIVDYKEATETEEGYTGDTVCTECGETVKTGEKIPVKVPETPVVPDAPAATAGGTIDFSTTDSRVALDDNQQVWQQGSVIVTNEKAASTQSIKDYSNPARFYAHTNLTIACPGMTKLEAIIPTATYAAVWSNTNTDGNATITVSETSPTDNANDRLLTVTFATPVDSFTLTDLTAQTRMRLLTVYAEAAEEPATPVTNTYTFSDYKVDGELGGGEATRQLDDTVTFTISAGWFTTEARIYKNANGVIASTKPITSIVLNVGYKDSTFNVYTSEDGVTWTSYKEGVAYTSAYADVTIDFETPVQYIKIDAPNAQVRMKTLTVTMLDTGDTPDTPDTPETSEPECKHTDTEIVDYKDATETEEGYTGDTVCVDCGATVKTGEKIPVKVPETPVTPSIPLTNGMKVVIYVPGYNKALTSEATGNYLKGVAITVADGKVTGYGDSAVWTVIVNEDGTYSFENGGKKIGMQASYASMSMGSVNDKWQVISLGDGLYNIKNTVRGNFMEWYNQYSNWSTYNSSSATTDPQFQIAFFEVVEEEAPACEHKNTKLENAKEATETEEGYTGDTVCTDCGVTVKTGEKIPVKVPETPVTPSIPLTNGMKVVIYVPGYNKALTSEATGNYLKGVTITVADGKVTGYGDSAVWTVIVNEDGTYSFENGGKKIGMQASYASMSMGSVNDKWQVISLGDGLYNIKNTVRGNFMEWYNQYSNWSTYNSSSATTDPQFQIAFFEVVEEEAPACEHKNTKLENAKEATETEEGYTGDTVCTDCGETIKTGEKIPVKTPVTPPVTEPETTPDAPVFGVITAPKAGVAYKFGMVQGNLNKTFYLKGGMNGYYMDTTESVDAAIDVYLEETDGGFYLYTMVNGAKTYINMVVSGTHVNGAYEATASTVYTWDAEHGTLISEVNGKDYWFGTRNDKTYTTVGPCAVEYDGFYCQFYGVEEVEEPETNVPKTGDTIVVLVAMVLVAGAALTIISRKRRCN